MTITPCLIELPDRARFRLTGPDRERFLNGQVSNRVNLATAQHTIEACVCNVKGKLDGVVFITRSDDGEALLIDAPGELRESLFARLDRYLIADDCELTDITGDETLVHALGAPPEIPGAVWSRANRFGPLGWDWWRTTDARTTAPGLTEDCAAVEEIRIRHGVPRWGVELSAEVLPAEAGLDRRAIDFHKGCYLGQEVISRIESVGRVNRSLCLLARTGDAGGAIVSPGEALFATDSDKQAGTVTSVADDGDWLLAWVKRDWTAPETGLVTRQAEGKVPVETWEVRTFETAGD